MVAVDACCVKVDWSKQANRLNAEISSPRNGIVPAHPSAHPSQSCSRAMQPREAAWQLQLATAGGRPVLYAGHHHES
jgi:hypothetical protein